MNSPKRYSPEVREPVVRLVIEKKGEYPSKWAAICSIASKFGCTPETLIAWCKRTGVTQEDSSVKLSERERLKQLERENVELKRANEILREAAALFTQAEFDRKPN
ncbi:transposase [Halomonas sp. ISL-60]|uniref:transposase n=1 Tax=Halomonas sp. ISL-56 TaxID=2819149 RepID=UPI001BECAD45|nr:transposase [Halomonas sp. ISL-56]MBT2772665.1 transposase [Halomonas sp. ISL-60]MBT2802343.1 transposase [Halomonas sp. ISL-56]